MPGPWLNPKFGIYWVRKTTPKELRDKKRELLALGIPYQREFQKSLGTSNTAEAQKLYVGVMAEISATLDTWREALKSGRQPLSFMEQKGLADSVAKLIVDRYEVDPLTIPDTSAPNTNVRFDDGVQQRLRQLPGYQLKALRDVFQSEIAILRDGDEIQRMKMLKGWEDGDGFIGRFSSLKESFHNGMETLVGTYLDEVLIDKRRPSLLPQDRRMVCFMAAGRRDEALKALRSMVGGDDEAINKIKSKRGYTKAPPPKSSTTFEDIISGQELKDSDTSVMRSNKKKSENTLKKYRTTCREFAKWRGSESVTSISSEEVYRWMDHLYDRSEGKNSRTTVRHKVNALKAVCNWGQEHSRRGPTLLFPDGLPLEDIALPERDPVDSSKRCYSIRQAKMVLRAARMESKPDLRWAPWLLAYTGMRIGDVQLLKRTDFKQVRECHFIRISFEKTTEPRWIPLHKALVDEGFLDFITTKREPYFPKRTQGNISGWVHKVLEGEENIPAPNHGWRNLIESLFEKYGVSIRANLYLAGRALSTEAKELQRSSARAYQNPDLALLTYWDELNKVGVILDMDEN